jgi:predicted membrane metal-binding protein
MILSPLIQARWPARWHQSLVGSVALESICAEAMSLPFVLYIFGQMSFIGLPANVLVVTLVPLAMLLGVIAGLAGMLASSFAGWLAWPATLLLTYMLDIAHLMAHIPHVFVQNTGLPLAGMLGLYGIIILLAAILWRRTKPAKSGIITDMNDVETRGLTV